MSQAELSERYRLEDRIEGGQSLVFKAVDLESDRPVAVRTANDITARDERRLESFTASLRTLSGLDHPNIVKTVRFHEPGELGPLPYLVTEWIDTTLEDLLREQRMEPNAALEIVYRILDGLKAIHGTGIVHRDLKPDNILVSADGREVRIADLGGAEGTLRNSSKYTAPECYAEGQRVGAPADVYAVGMMAYELLLGREKFEDQFPEIYGSTDERIQLARWVNWHRDPLREARSLADVDPGIPRAISTTIAQMMAKDPAQRVHDADAAIGSLRGAGDSSGAQDVPVLSLEEERGRGGRPLWLMGWRLYALAGLVFVLVLGSGLAFKISGERARTDDALAAYEQLEAARARAVEAGAETPLLEPFARGDERKETGNALWNADEMGGARDAYLEGAALFDQAAAEALALYGPDGPGGPGGPGGPDGPGGPLPDRVMLGSTAAEIDAALALCLRHVEGCARDWYADETEREYRPTAFQMDVLEVTNAQFAAFVQETGWVTDAEKAGLANKWTGIGSVMVEGVSWRAPDGAGSSFADRLQHPVRVISWNDADAYCRWSGGRLPTEDEWEFAARGAGRRVFPWGDTFEPGPALWFGESQGAPATREAGSFPDGATPEGIRDLAGSVWEWTATRGPEGHFLKGGSYADENPANLRAAARRQSPPGEAHVDDGFRCVSDP